MSLPFAVLKNLTDKSTCKSHVWYMRRLFRPEVWTSHTFTFLQYHDDILTPDNIYITHHYSVCFGLGEMWAHTCNTYPSYKPHIPSVLSLMGKCCGTGCVAGHWFPPQQERGTWVMQVLTANQSLPNTLNALCGSPKHTELPYRQIWTADSTQQMNSTKGISHQET